MECNRKIKSVMIETNRCKCNNLYCDTHLHPNHLCSYDYLKEHKQQLMVVNPNIQTKKVQKI